MTMMNSNSSKRSLIVLGLLATLSLSSARNIKGHRVEQISLDQRELDQHDVDQLDLGLFRQHEEGFPGGLFYPDEDGEDELKRMVPKWRQVHNGGKAAGKGIAGKAGKWKTLKSCKEWKSKAPSVGKGSTKSPSYGKGSTKSPSYYLGKGSSKAPTVKSDKYCSDAPTMAPTAVPTKAPTKTPTLSPTTPLPTIPQSKGPTPTISPGNEEPTREPTPTTTGKAGKGDSSKAPSVGGKGKAGKGKNEDFDASDEDCQAIADSTDLKAGGPTVSFLDPSMDFDTTFRIKSKNGVNVESLLDKYSKYARLYVLGCFELAADELDGIELMRRRLQTEPLFQATMNDWSEQTDDCTGSDPKTCNYDNTITTYYENSGDATPDEKLIKERVKDALKVIAGELANHPDVEDVKVDNVVAAKSIANNNSADDDDNKGLIAGVTAGLLAFLLLAMFMKRRRNGDEEVSHLKFEGDEDTFVPEFAGKDDRRAHIIGESDSVMSGWTGHSMEDEYSQGSDNAGKLGHTKGDVHMCSSATCEVCERKRQMGVKFIKTSTPPTPSRPRSVPSDASREYVAEDVVAL